MKRIVCFLFLLQTSQFSIGQQYIDLRDGSIITDSIVTTFPTRTVEDVKDGILVTYEFHYVSKNTDVLFPSSSILFFDGFGIGEVPGKPALPIKWDKFYVPSGQDYSISIIDSSYIELPIEIAPARQAMINSSRTIYTTDNVAQIKPYEGIFPRNTISSETNVYRTYPILDICINPIRYNYQQNRVVICNRISYLISIKDKDSKYILNNLDFDRDPLLANNIMNPRKQIENKGHGQLRSAIQITTPKYLIVTVPQFLDAVNKLADWKRSLGYNVEIISQNSWNDISIKNAIVSTNQISPISYLLIFGDYNDIPGKYITRSVNTTDGLKNYQFYTDYYYGCIQSDTIPDIRRGRISASSLNEATTIVDKIINYERNPNITSSFYQTGLNCAYFQDDNYYNDQNVLIKARDSVEDRRFTLTSEEIRNHVIQQNKIVKRVYYAESEVTPMFWKKGGYGMANQTPIPSELLKSNNFLWNGNSQDIKDSINYGTFYVFHRDHGGVTEWGEPNFTSTHIGQLNNGNKLPVVFSMNCLTGRYNQGTCFAEAFLRKEEGGCAGIFAASEESFSGYNDALALAMFEAIWPNPSFIKPFPSGVTPIQLTNTPVYRLGDLLDYGFTKIKDVYPGAYGDYILHTKEIFHYFGDPTMEIYTDVPTPFTNVSITKNNGNTIVSVGENATITFYNRTTGTIESFYGSSVTYPNNNNVQVCISAHNKIPYIKEAGCLFIQNVTITNNSTYHADQIKVGSNVTPLIPTGPVIVTNGKTTLIGDTIELNGETTIELGAELEIKNN